jgi:hypothetical protein
MAMPPLRFVARFPAENSAVALSRGSSPHASILARTRCLSSNIRRDHYVCDRSSWQIKDEAVLAELVQLMNLSADEAAILKSLHDTAQKQARAMREDFYKRLLAHPQTAEYFSNINMKHMYETLQNWFVELFNGVYDETYARRRVTIGRVHVRIGLPVRYPIAMLDVAMAHAEAVARTHPQPDAALAAVRKVVALDVAVFNQAYEDRQIQILADTVGNERLARRLLSEE